MALATPGTGGARPPDLLQVSLGRGRWPTPCRRHCRCCCCRCCRCLPAKLPLCLRPSILPVAASPRLPQRIVPPILASFTDQDSRVRYYAIESLWNVVSFGFWGAMLLWGQCPGTCQLQMRELLKALGSLWPDPIPLISLGSMG